MTDKRNETTKPTSKKTPPVSFYLGDKPERDRRVNNLEGLAEKFGMTRSVLLQKIADGEFYVEPSPLERVRTGLEDIKTGRVVEVRSPQDLLTDS